MFVLIFLILVLEKDSEFSQTTHILKTADHERFQALLFWAEKLKSPNPAFINFDIAEA